MPFWGKKKDKENEPDLLDTLRPKMEDVHLPPGAEPPVSESGKPFRTKAYKIPVGKRDFKTVFLVGETTEDGSGCRVSIRELPKGGVYQGRELNVFLIEALQMAANFEHKARKEKWEVQTSAENIGKMHYIEFAKSEGLIVDDYGFAHARAKGRVVTEGDFSEQEIYRVRHLDSEKQAARDAIDWNNNCLATLFNTLSEKMSLSSLTGSVSDLQGMEQIVKNELPTLSRQSKALVEKADDDKIKTGANWESAAADYQRALNGLDTRLTKINDMFESRVKAQQPYRQLIAIETTETMLAAANAMYRVMLDSDGDKGIKLSRLVAETVKTAENIARKELGLTTTQTRELEALVMSAEGPASLHGFVDDFRVKFEEKYADLGVAALVQESEQAKRTAQTRRKPSAPKP